MTPRPSNPPVRRPALGLCLALTLGAMPALAAPVPARESVSPFLELEAEVPLGDVGVGLAIAATPAGELYLSDESRGGIRRLAADGMAWQPLIAADPGSKLPRHPAAIATDAAGRLWVTDTDRRRVVVIENADGQLIGLEVKAAASVTASDFGGLRKLAEASGKRFAAGFVLYDHTQTVPFGDRLFAVPISSLWA